MSDTEIIVQLLKNVEWRIRVNRVRHELVFGLLIVLIPLISLKIWDLFSPLKASTVAYLITSCGFLYAGYVVWRLRQKGTLHEAAISLDLKAGLNDEMRTAWWFINNPQSSEWVSRQIERAAKRARRVDLNTAYPGVVPRNSYTAGAMALLFVGLNFVPLPLNHNWLMLQAAPAAALSEKEEMAFDAAEEARRKDLFAYAEANDNFDLEEVNRGLEEIARDLLKADQLKEVAEAIMEKDLPMAAEEMRRMGGQMGADAPAASKNMLESFKNAAKNTTPGLEQLIKGLNELSESLAEGDEAAVQEAVEQVADELERLEGEMQTHETGGQQIARGMQTKAGQQSTQIRQAGESPQARSDSMGLGTSSSRGGGEGQLPETTLDVKIELDIKLQQAGLDGLQDFTSTPPVDLEEASKQERSKLDYRNVKSELSPAQKDVLNKDIIPWEYRPLIKSYFQAIRPPEKK